LHLDDEGYPAIKYWELWPKYGVHYLSNTPLCLLILGGFVPPKPQISIKSMFNFILKTKT